jgi:DNA-binding transcriptional MerR regulator
MTMSYLLPVPVPATQRLLRLDEFAARCGLHPEFVRRLVALGLIPAVRDAGGALRFSPSQVAAVARVQRLRAALPLNYAALGLVVDLLDRITELETLLGIRGRTEPVRAPAATRMPNATDQKRSAPWT